LANGCVVCAPSLSPPALGERLHCSLARRLVAVGSAWALGGVLRRAAGCNSASRPAAVAARKGPRDHSHWNLESPRRTGLQAASNTASALEARQAPAAPDRGWGSAR